MAADGIKRAGGGGLTTQMAAAGAAALKHLGLHARPAVVDQYGEDVWRVAVDAGLSPTVVTYRGTTDAPTAVTGPVPAADPLPAVEYARRAADLVADRFPLIFDAAQDIIDRVYAIESAPLAAPAAAVCLFLDAVRRKNRGGVDYEVSLDAAADTAWDRAVGRKSLTLSPPAERKANREQERAGTAAFRAVEGRVRADYPACPDMLRMALAAARQGRVSRRKLERGVDDARAAFAGKRPYHCPNPTARDVHGYRSKSEADALAADYDRWRAGVERAIAEAEAFLAAAAAGGFATAAAT